MVRFGSFPAKLIVGRDRRFFVHERAVRSNSVFLNDAFQLVWIDNHKCRTVSFPDLEPEVFEGYLNFLYGMLKPHVCSHSSYSRHHYLARLYGFGKEIKDRKFQDAVLDQMIYESRQKWDDGLNYYPGGATIKLMYDTTPNDSPAR